MKTKPIILSLSLLLLSGTALADDDCDDPVASWQPRENLREKLEAEGLLYGTLWKDFAADLEKARKQPAGSVMAAIDSLPQSLAEANGASVRYERRIVVVRRR